MKAVVGYFRPGETRQAYDALIAAGFRPDDVRELSAGDDVPPYVEGEPEKAASWGWLAGTLVGGLIGAVAGWLLYGWLNLTLTTILASLFILVSAAAGAAIGGYLVAIYSVRADEELDMDVREALGEGNQLLVVHASESGVTRAIEILSRHRSRHIATYSVPEEELNRA